ncbi:MAG: dihydrofolate reductase [Candidatus Vogelbacteria bacterium]|nr:dihydrofolate reductase [Candidatus Vogelbacteria bacterium]
MMISLVVAMDENRVIGKDGKLPWDSMPADMARFKRITTGHVVIMGRKTFESIGRALPKRINIVVTRDVRKNFPGAIDENSLESAIRLAEDSLRSDEVFVIGGGRIFDKVIKIADRLYVTLVHAEVLGGDTFFPKIDKNAWKEAAREFHDADSNNEFDYEFITYERR